MATSTIPNWTAMTDLDIPIRSWRHDEYDIWMTVSHQPDHYEDGEQVMRWHARVTLGKNITVGKNAIYHCPKHGCEAAEEQAMEWARNWMASESEAFIDSLDNAEEWRLDD